MLRSLSYFDNLNLASRVKARTMVACAARDLVCPPNRQAIIIIDFSSFLENETITL